MKNKVLAGLIALAVIFSFSVMMTSCAKKQVRVSGAAQPAAESKPAMEKAPEKEAAPAAAKGAGEEKAERLKKVREQEKSQLIADFESKNIYFDFDKSELKPEAKAVLKAKADFLSAYPEYALRIDGNCDERGTVEYNLALGDRRANAAKQYLMDLGISEHRISTISYGKERPVDPRHNEEAWAKNRHDGFTLIKRW
jgi:peptidoglycan-associated lipoprotein